MAPDLFAGIRVSDYETANSWGTTFEPLVPRTDSSTVALATPIDVSDSRQRGYDQNSSHA